MDLIKYENSCICQPNKLFVKFKNDNLKLKEMLVDTKEFFDEAHNIFNYIEKLNGFNNITALEGHLNSYIYKYKFIDYKWIFSLLEIYYKNINNILKIIKINFNEKAKTNKYNHLNLLKNKLIKLEFIMNVNREINYMNSKIYYSKIFVDNTFKDYKTFDSMLSVKINNKTIEKINVIIQNQNIILNSIKPITIDIKNHIESNYNNLSLCIKFINYNIVIYDENEEKLQNIINTIDNNNEIISAINFSKLEKINLNYYINFIYQKFYLINLIST